MPKRRATHLLLEGSHPADPYYPLTACGLGDVDNVTNDPLAVTCRGECAGAALDVLRDSEAHR